MSTELTTAFTTAFTTISGDVMDVLGIIVPIAIGIAGVLFVVRKAMSWFKGMAR